MPKVCAVPGCRKTTEKNQKYSIFQVPQDEESRRKWEAAIPNIKHLRSSQYLCERHFEPGCIVRNLLKRGPDGKIVINIPYKRPRLLESSVPSIFVFKSPSAHEVTDKENNAEAVPAVLVSELHPDEVVPYSVPNADPLRTNSNLLEVDEYPHFMSSDDVVIEPVLKDTATELHAPEIKVESSSHASDISTVAGSPNSDSGELNSDDQSMIFLVKNEAEITFQLAKNICTVKVSKPWNVLETSSAGDKRLILFQIMINKANHDVPVIRLSVMIDQRKKIQYAVHGKLVTNSERYLPQDLTEPQNLLGILKDVERLCVCVGLKKTNTELAEAGSVCVDNMNMNRSKNCMLLGKNKTCNICVRLRRALQQKNIRLQKRGQFKRFTHSSSTVAQSELRSMRLKIKSERRAKNRAMGRLKLLSDSLKQKQDELNAIKDQLLNQEFASCNMPEMQKIALQEIIAAAKHTDTRGRRYSKEWITMCMLMMTQSPAYYEFVRKSQIVPLPCMTTVRRYFSLYDSKCSFDQNFFEVVDCDEINLETSLTASSNTLTYAGLTDFRNDGPTTTDMNDDPTASDINDGPTTTDINDGPTATNKKDGPTATDTNDGLTATDTNDGPTATDINEGQTASNRNDGRPATDRNDL